jgi:hypothetical protein
MTIEMVHSFGDFVLFYTLSSLPAVLISILLAGYLVSVLVTNVSNLNLLNRITKWVVAYYVLVLAQATIVYGYNMIVYQKWIVSEFTNASLAFCSLLIGFYLYKFSNEKMAKIYFSLTILFIYNLISPYFIVY